MSKSAVFALAAILVGTACRQDQAANEMRAFAALAMKAAPKETEIVAGIRMAAMRQVPALQALFARSVGGDAAEMKQLCGYEPMEAAQMALLALGPDLDPMTAVLVIRGDWDADKIGSCFTQVGTKRGGAPTITRDGDVVVMTDTVHPQRDVALGWIDAHTIVMSLADRRDAARVKALVAGGSSALDNAPLQEIVRKADLGGGMWIAAASLDPARLGNIEKLLGTAPSAAWLGARFGADVTLRGGARFDSEADARTIADGVKAALAHAREDPLLGGLKVDVRAEGRDVLVHTQVDDATFERITTPQTVEK